MYQVLTIYILELPFKIKSVLSISDTETLNILHFEELRPLRPCVCNTLKNTLQVLDFREIWSIVKELGF